MVAAINSSQIKTNNHHRTRLLRKASKTFLLTALVLMTLSAAALYFYTKDLLRREIEEELYSNKDLKRKNEDSLVKRYR